ncbi:MAG TPA: tRNA pseudouridine(38-40) synthase TruA [Methanospirillum sp.]|nr:tRNA pseudouridine(38-40) synthase TruA [Methanospirillum sp.]
MAEVQETDRPVRLAFRIGYLGTGFFGSQFQPDHRTVEGEIIAACTRAGLIQDRQSFRLAFSGRTDRGVHARSQIIAFTTPLPDRARRALPGQLPPDIWAFGFCEVPERYSPRKHVISRTYRYLYGGRPANLPQMQEAAECFIGRHNFRCFARIEPDKIPWRTVLAIRVYEEEGICRIEITAESYLWHMVRGIASALLKVGNGTLSRDQIIRMLSGECTSRIDPAPSEGLILWDIDDDLSWQPLDPMKRTTVRLHTEGESYHRVMTEVHHLLML